MPEHTCTALGFDFGMRKIGLAVGQTISCSAQPIAIIAAVDGIPNWDHIAAHIVQWQPTALVVGLPYNMDGTTQEITLAAKKFGRRLEAKYRLPVHYVDERLTTKTAAAELYEQAKKPKKLDSYAAVLILESWLREQTDDN